MTDLSYENLMTDTNDYLILDGTVRSYDLREEIQSWGGFWDEENEAWRVDCIDKSDMAYRALMACGLNLKFMKVS